MLADIDKETVVRAELRRQGTRAKVLPVGFESADQARRVSRLGWRPNSAAQPHRDHHRVSCLARQSGATVDELIEHVPAPDFPTAGIIYGTEGVREGYRNGRGGSSSAPARTSRESIKGGPQAIIVDELPYQVNKATLLTRIGELVREKSSTEYPTCATSPTNRACAW